MAPSPHPSTPPAARGTGGGRRKDPTSDGRWRYGRQAPTRSAMPGAYLVDVGIDVRDRSVLLGLGLGIPLHTDIAGQCRTCTPISRPISATPRHGPCSRCRRRTARPGSACLRPQGRGGGVGTRPWWLALLACGGAYWPLAPEPSAMTSRHPHYCGHPHCRGHPPAPGGDSRMQLLPMASSSDGLISAPGCGHHEDPRLGGAHHNQRECHTRPWVPAHQCVTCR